MNPLLSYKIMYVPLSLKYHLKILAPMNNKRKDKVEDMYKLLHEFWKI